MKNVLVTGGAGFIGSNFVRFALTKDPRLHITVLDALTYAGSRDNLQGLARPYRFIHGDICQKNLVLRLMRDEHIDAIVHFAAETHVDRSLDEPDAFIRTNVMGTLVLLEAALKAWKGASSRAERYRFHHVSTDEVYGSLGEGERAWPEDAPYDPHSPYAASKAASDHLVRAYGRTYGLPFSITNCSNNYGPHQFPEKLIPLLITSAVAGQSLPIYGDGKQSRDWLHVEDHCRAIWAVLKEGRSGETYNIGGQAGSGRSVRDLTNLALAEKVCSILDETRPAARGTSYRDLIRFVPDRPGHDRRYAVDSRKIRRELGWKPEYRLDAGLQKTVAWYLENEAWVEAIRKRTGWQKWIEKNYDRRNQRKGAGR